MANDNANNGAVATLNTVRKAQRSGYRPTHKDIAAAAQCGMMWNDATKRWMPV